MSDVETLPTVVLENARTGQPIVVDQRDYLARRHNRYANWRMLDDGGLIAPPPLPSEIADDDGLAATLARPTLPSSKSRRHP